MGEVGAPSGDCMADLPESDGNISLLPIHWRVSRGRLASYSCKWLSVLPKLECLLDSGEWMYGEAPQHIHDKAKAGQSSP